MDSEVKPWDRQPGEPPQWFHRFDKYYRPLGPERTLEETYRRWKQVEAKHSKGKRPSVHWYNAAKTWQWLKRSQAWDAQERQKRIAAEEKARHEMLQRHARQAQTLQSIGVLKLSSFDMKRIAALQPSERAEAMKDISATEARHYIGDGVKLERQALGLPEHLLAVAQMTETELLERYSGILTAIAGTGSDTSGDDQAWDIATSVDAKDEAEVDGA